MLSLPPSVRIFVAVDATDMRKSFDGLASEAQRVIAQDSLSGHLFVFFNLQSAADDGEGAVLGPERLLLGGQTPGAWNVRATRSAAEWGLEMEAAELD